MDEKNFDSEEYDMECSICGKQLTRYIYIDGEYICLRCGAELECEEMDGDSNG